MAATIRASEKGLQTVDQARRKKGWTKKATAWCDAAGSISPSTLDRFWARTPISQESFVAICTAVGENWETIADLPSSNYSLPQVSTYNQQTWVGRKSLISDLLPKLQRQTRLLWITGISGIGKTTLGECLVSQAWAIDPTFQWIYLEVLEGQSPDFPSIAADLLAKLGDRDLDPQERNNPDHLARRLLQKLQSHPYWIQLDALERLLKPEHSTEFIDPYWATFLQRCLTEPAFTSRLLLTSQAFPNALVELDDRYSNVWTEIRLDGLLQVEQQLEFFAKRGIAVDAANRDILAQIAKIYEGHPLVLKVIAEDILKDFAGDVVCYWQVYQPEFEQVARELQQTIRLNETDYNEALDRKVRDRIKKSLEQLPTDALDLLCRSAVFRRPVPKKFWLAMIGDYSPKRQKEAYRTLGDRALVEKEGIHQGQFLIRQHNLIRDIAYDLLRQDSAIWETTERQAAELWLTAYEPAPDASNIETVRGYLEAFDHYCGVKDWNAANQIAWTRLNTSTQDYLAWQLGNWGCLSEAVTFHQKQLCIAREMKDTQNIEAALGNLGLVYNKLGNYPQAIDFLLQCLTVVQETGNRRSEGIVLGRLGTVYKNLGQYEQAIDFHQQHLSIAREIGNRRGEGIALGNLGVVHRYLWQYEQAIDFYQQHLSIAREIDNRRDEGSALGNLGNAYSTLGNYQQAIDFYQQALIVCQETGDRRDEGVALVGIGEIQLKLEQYSKSLINTHTALEIFGEIGDRAAEAKALKNLAELHQVLGEIDSAKQYCDRALALAIELGIPLAEECRSLMEELNQQHE